MAEEEQEEEEDENKRIRPRERALGQKKSMLLQKGFVPIQPLKREVK